jgi:hypothetical protein
MDIDKTRRQHAPFGFHDVLRRPATQLADRDNPALLHRHIALNRRRARSVDHPCAFDQRIDVFSIQCHVQSPKG